MAAEKSIIRTLKQMLNNDAIMYYILWKYAPDAIPEEDNIKTYSDLCNKYKALQGRTEQSVEKSLYKEEVQAAIKVLLKRLDGKRDIELLNKYYDLAMSGDVQALKAYMEFKTKFFKDSEDGELKAILNGASTSVDYSDTEDFKMEF
ncbi:MAG: hypothetical protein J6J23_00860 [Clostridia bacterium]|nr:hypothetical protein [Clostridia bacterium]